MFIWYILNFKNEFRHYSVYVSRVVIWGITLYSYLATSYHIQVKTGDVSSAGTDANVYLIIYGAKGDTGQLMLRQSASFKNKFERGKTDLFKIEATDIGQVQLDVLVINALCSTCMPIFSVQTEIFYS